MIQEVYFFIDYPLVKLWGIPFLSTLDGNADKSSARHC